MLPEALLKEYWRALSMAMRFFDVVIVAFAGWVAYLARFQSRELGTPYLFAILLSALVVPVVFNSCKIYASVRSSSYIKHILQLIQALFLTSMVLACLSFFTKSGALYSRVWFIAWMMSAFMLLTLCRGSILIALRFMRANGLNERRVVIFGRHELGKKIANRMQHALWTGFKIVTFMDDGVEPEASYFKNIPLIKTPASLSEYLQKEAIDEIWLALPLSAEGRVKEILYELRHQTTMSRFVLDIFGLDLLSHSVSDLAGFPVINIRGTPMIGINRWIKALEDRVIALIILALISPLLLFIALGVRLSSKGPIFFKQERLGWDGKIIKIYKFRTMIEHHEAAGLVTQAKLDDARITRFGKFLRCTSLDELPQFINVLQGRMSIVGPRPHALPHNELYKDKINTYMQRHRVKPGITGWAQVNGWRGETDTLNKMEKRVEYDLYYINNWSLSFDLKIIFLTIFRGFLNRNAY